MGFSFAILYLTSLPIYILFYFVQSNSTQNFTITKSCPGLVEVKEEDLVPERPILVTISTQTDCLPQADAQIVNRSKNDGLCADQLSNLFGNLTLDDGDSRLVDSYLILKRIILF